MAIYDYIWPKIALLFPSFFEQPCGIGKTKKFTRKNTKTHLNGVAMTQHELSEIGQLQSWFTFELQNQCT